MEKLNIWRFAFALRFDFYLKIILWSFFVSESREEIKCFGFPNRMEDNLARIFISNNTTPLSICFCWRADDVAPSDEIVDKIRACNSKFT